MQLASLTIGRDDDFPTPTRRSTHATVLVTSTCSSNIPNMHNSYIMAYLLQCLSFSYFLSNLFMMTFLLGLSSTHRKSALPLTDGHALSLSLSNNVSGYSVPLGMSSHLFSQHISARLWLTNFVLTAVAGLIHRLA